MAAALLGATLLAPAAAQQEGAAPPAEKPPAAGAEAVRVSVEAKDADLRAVLDNLFKQARISNYTIANNVAGWITISLKDKPFEDALTLIARVASPPLTWAKRDGFYEVKVRAAPRYGEAPGDAPAPAPADTVALGDGRRFEVIKLMYADARDVAAVLGGLRPENLTGAVAYVPANQVLTRWGGPAGSFVSGSIGEVGPFGFGGRGTGRGGGSVPGQAAGQAAGYGQPAAPAADDRGR